MSVLLGNGNGTFQAAVNYGAGSSPYSVAVGDFNGDGKADLAVANDGSNNVSVLLGNGNGTFQAAVNYAAGTYPCSVAVGDFNGDGKADLAVANYDSNNVSVLLGNGNGTFQAAVNYAAGTVPIPLRSGTSTATARPTWPWPTSGSNERERAAGQRQRHLPGGGELRLGRDPASVAVGDFNGDGRADLAVANFYSHDVSILLGTWLPVSTATTLAAAPNPSTFGQTVTLTATVSPSAAAGQVTFFDGSTVLGVGTLAGGTATCKPASCRPAAGPCGRVMAATRPTWPAHRHR